MLALRRLAAYALRGFILAALVLALGMTFSLNALPQGGASLDKPVFVVATASQDGGFWKRAVMLAVPAFGGHVGLIINRPSQYSMAEIFPDHEPSRAVEDRLYIGGDFRPGVIVALARAEASPGGNSIEMMPGLWLVVQSAVIDKIIAERPNEARYFAGSVFWEQGELADEIARGWMVLRPADPAKLFSDDTSKLYDELAPAGGKPGLET